MEEDRELNNPKALLIKTKGAGRGSGFFVEGDLIVTNIHVVARGTSVSAELRDPETNVVIKEFIVKGVKAFDAKNDLVILKVTGKGKVLPIGDSDLLQRGNVVQVIGYPRGKYYRVTEGPIHSIRDSDKWVRMDLKADRGNSGSPVLDNNGEVIGVAVTVVDYLTFAIPVKAVKMLLAQTEEIEPLAQWQKRKEIRAYAYFGESNEKHSPDLYHKAIVDLDRAIQLNPNCVYFYHSRGFVKSQLGKLKTDEGDIIEANQFYRGTITDSTEAIKLCPDYAAVYNNRGTAKSNIGQSKLNEGNVTEAQQYYQDAITDYTETIKLCPDYALIYNNRADAKCFLGKSEEAVGNVEAAQSLYQESIIDINRAIELDSSCAVFYHTSGQIKAALGDYSAAIENYETAREKDPDYTDVCKDLELAKEALEQMKG